DLAQAQGRDRAAQARAAPTQRQDRRGQAEEEHPDRARQAGRGDPADSGDDVGDVRQERVRVVRPDGREDRGDRAQSARGGGAAGGILGRYAGQAVRGARVPRHGRPAAAGAQAAYGTLAGWRQPGETARHGCQWRARRRGDRGKQWRYQALTSGEPGEATAGSSTRTTPLEFWRPLLSGDELL